MDHYGRTLSPALQGKPALKVAAFKPIQRSALNPKAILNVSKSINKGTQSTASFDKDRDESQFSALEQAALREAYTTGNFDSLSGKLKAFVEYQVSQKEQAITDDLAASATALNEMAKAEAEKQQQAELERQKAIQAQKNKQMIIYGLVGIGGLGLLYFVSKR